jgi:hypothetical protein
MVDFVGKMRNCFNIECVHYACLCMYVHTLRNTIMTKLLQFTGEKKISLLLGQLSILSQPIKTSVFLMFEYALHAEPDRYFACTLLIKYIAYCINVKLVPRARHSKQLSNTLNNYIINQLYHR